MNQLKAQTFAEGYGRELKTGVRDPRSVWFSCIGIPTSYT